MKRVIFLAMLVCSMGASASGWQGYNPFQPEPATVFYGASKQAVCDQINDSYRHGVTPEPSNASTRSPGTPISKVDTSSTWNGGYDSTNSAYYISPLVANPNGAQNCVGTVDYDYNFRGYDYYTSTPTMGILSPN